MRQGINPLEKKSENKMNAQTQIQTEKNGITTVETHVNQPDTKAIAKRINKAFEGVTDREISFGIFLKSAGPKWVTILNCHGKTSIEKIPTEAFADIGVTIRNYEECYEQTFGECLSDYRDSQY